MHLKAANRVQEHTKGRAQLCQKTGQTVPTAQVVCEATGGYERPVVQDLHNAKTPSRSSIPPGFAQPPKPKASAPKTTPLMPWASTDYGQRYQPEPTTAAVPSPDQWRP